MSMVVCNMQCVSANHNSLQATLPQPLLAGSCFTACSAIQSHKLLQADLIHHIYVCIHKRTDECREDDAIPQGMYAYKTSTHHLPKHSHTHSRPAACPNQPPFCKEEVNKFLVERRLFRQAMRMRGGGPPHDADMKFALHDKSSLNALTALFTWWARAIRQDTPPSLATIAAMNRAHSMDFDAHQRRKERS